MLQVAPRPLHPKVTVIIPALNEARNLPHVFSGCRRDCTRS